MGFFSRLFGKKEEKPQTRERKDQPSVFDIPSESDRMNWAIEKANLTLHYFEESLKKPSPAQQYFSIKVKIIDGNKAEHIWLSNPNFDTEGNLFGVVGNEPIDVKTVALNQKIGIDRNLISDWMIVENGRLIGGYTIRAIRVAYSGKDLENFDKGLGGIFVDEGVDYFVPNLETPEGAILLLESAYDEKDLEKAMSCKDFNKEAELMLSKIGKGLEQGGAEIIKKTAEVLMLSYTKSLQENGMPNFKGIKRAFPERQKVSEDHLIITEICQYPDGNKSSQKLNVCKIGKEWKVLGPAE